VHGDRTALVLDEDAGFGGEPSLEFLDTEAEVRVILGPTWE
jgi:hypothetical protein